MKKVILAFLMLITCFNFFVPVTYAKELGAVDTVPCSEVMTIAETGEAIDVTANPNMETMYYLNVPLKGYTVGLKEYKGLAGGAFLDLGEKTKKFAEKINNTMQTFVFTYNNIKVGGFPVMTTWNIKVSVSRYHFGFGVYFLKFVFAEDAKINIRSEYYDVFQDADFSDISITFLYEGKGYLIENSEVFTFWQWENYHPFHNIKGITTEKREVPPDYNYLEEEGQLPDNGGVVVSPIKNENETDFLTYTINAFKAVFEGNANIIQYIVVFVSSLVGLFLLGLVINILAWIFK